MLTSIVESKAYELNAMNNVIYAGEKFRSETKEVIFEALLNLFPINFTWCDSDGYIIGVNKNELNFFDANDVDEIIGKKITEIASKEAWKNTKKVLKTGISLVTEEHHIDKNGNKTYFISVKSPIKNNNQIVGVVCIALNITERKRMEEVLQLASQTKTEFLANMRHDLRTPFCGILGMAELLECQETDPIKKDNLGDIVKCSQSLLNHLNEIIDFIEVESGKFPVLEKEFDIYLIIDDVVKMLMPSARSKNLVFDIIVDKNVHRHVLGDSVRLQRILINLVSNAIKFTDEGYVHVIVNWHPSSEDKAIVEFIIKDTGIGIPKKSQEIIFEKFTRLSPSYKGIYDGKGFGLSIVKEFLEDIGGQFEVTSEVEEGTTFKLFIPYKISLARQIITKVNKILLVDGSKIASKSCKGILERETDLNCEVDIAETGEKAIKLLENNHYDLVLMDIGLPDINGYEVAKKIRSYKNSYLSKIPIVVLSDDEDERKKCFEAGIDEFISKPLTKKVLEDFKTYLPFGQDYISLS